MLKLSKAIKLGKSVRLLRRRLALPALASIALGAVAVALAAAMIAYMLVGEPPLDNGGRTVALIVARMVARQRDGADETGSTRRSCHPTTGRG